MNVWTKFLPIFQCLLVFFIHFYTSFLHTGAVMWMEIPKLFDLAVFKVSLRKNSVAVPVLTSAVRFLWHDLVTGVYKVHPWGQKAKLLLWKTRVRGEGCAKGLEWALCLLLKSFKGMWSAGYVRSTRWQVIWSVTDCQCKIWWSPNNFPSESCNLMQMLRKKRLNEIKKWYWKANKDNHKLD